MRCLLAFLACFVLYHGTVQAADIRATPFAALPDTALITVSGGLENSDADKFWAAAAIYPKAIVALQSNGGSLLAGIDIGKKIRLRNYITYVPTGVCASACAFAWLGGTKRLMGPGALVGFHAANVTENGQATESGAGNALLGAYLNELGLPDRAVYFIAKAPPNDMTWLTMADAAREGIDVELFIMPGEAPNPSPGPAPTATPTVTLENRAAAALSELVDRLSQPASEAMAYVNAIYPAQVMYFGKYTARDQVIQDNLKYMQRWPERKYEVIQDSANCDAAEMTCLINGQMKWIARSVVRNIEAVGIAEFSYKFGFSNGRPQLLMQTSHVISRSSRSINAPAPATLPEGTTQPNMIAAPLVLPRVVSPKYAWESPAEARMHTCLEQYVANKATNSNGGLKWIQLGGGYYSACNQNLK